MFTRRLLSRECMDDPAATPAEQHEALRFIRLVNRRLGGISAALAPLRRWSRDWTAGRAIRIIDVGTGSADIPLAIAGWATANGHAVHITAVDLHPVTLKLAREFVGARPEIEFLEADALKLMDVFSPGAFDYAHAGMFLHHLADVEVVTMLRIMDRLTTRGVIWNDLARGWIERLAVRVMTLGAPPHVRHDAIVSVAAGFTRREAMDLAARAGLTGIRHRRHLFGRFALTSLKPASHSK